MSNRSLQVHSTTKDQLTRLQKTLQQEREILREEEAQLAEQQAAINAFRMHCRLKLGDWVEQLELLRSEKQRLLTRSRLQQQAEEDGRSFEEAEWLGQEYTSASETVDPSLAEANDSPQPDANKDRRAEKRLYRELARRFHPDLAENSVQKAYCTSMMASVNEAYATHNIQAMKDLAGELDPNVVADIVGQGIQESRELRQLQKKIRRCRQRIRRIRQQMSILRKESTARFWRQAQAVRVSAGQNWWEEVAAALRQEINHLSNEVAELNHAVRPK